MKKILSVILASLMLFSIGGCKNSEARSVEKLITDVVESNKPDASSIDDALTAYNNLSEELQGEVSNYEDLIGAELAVEEWVVLLDYSLNCDRQVRFETDGSGTMVDDNNWGWELEWSIDDESISVKSTSSRGSIKYYSFELVPVDDYYILQDEDNHMVLAQVSNEDDALDYLKAERIASAVSIDNLDSLSVDEYTNTPIRIDITVVRGVVTEHWIDYRYNSSDYTYLAYLGLDDVRTLSVGEEVTIIGYMNEYGDLKVIDAFIVR